jgi:hypothetical protein
MNRRRVLIGGFVLAVLAGGTLAALALRDGREEPSVGAPDTTPTESSPTPTVTAPPENESSGPIRFVLADSYVAGETVDVRIENVGTRAYVRESPRGGRAGASALGRAFRLAHA